MNLEKVREAAERVARSEGLEIADVEWLVGKQRFLRVYIDRVANPPRASNGGDSSDAGPETSPEANSAMAVDSPYAKVSHADCERVSQQLSVILDVEDLISGPSYTLEVSSPGMDRALKKPSDFDRFRGRLVKITTTEPVGDSKFFEGRLLGFSGGRVSVELKGKETRRIELPLETIRKANLVVEF
ncbi:MAG: ribosome maturation factor RimP [Candidatus Acidiferrum sp.]